MDETLFWLLFGGLMAALVVVPPVIAPVDALIIIFKAPGTNSGGVGRWLAQFFLHPGLWCLALTVVALYYVWSLSHPHWLWALAGGLALGIAVLLGAMALAYLRRRQHAAPVSLTPELLAT